MSSSEERTVIVDARGMLPPEPMERTLEALEQLRPDQTLCLIIPRHPAPLLDMLEMDGYPFDISRRDDGCLEITIQPCP